MPDSFHLPNGNPKTVIVTGGAGGIGAQTIRSYYSAGCNVVIADLPFAKDGADKLVASLPDSKRAMFHPVDIVNWDDMRALFRETKKRFGQVDIVIANAGLMESKGFFDFDEDDNGELKEPTEAFKIVDVNLKGTMNSTYGDFGCKSLLNVTSIAPGHTFHVVQYTRLGRCKRIGHPHSLNIGLLWRHRGSVIHFIQARCCRSSSRFTKKSQ
jgi:NAD(P)-dependent dehydrogenase (short-subunit alcohol dehydrogenase family)